jgi:hypothetical protein
MNDKEKEDLEYLEKFCEALGDAIYEIAVSLKGDGVPMKPEGYDERRRPR